MNDLPPTRADIEDKIEQIRKEHANVERFMDISQEWTIIASTYQGVIDALTWVLNGGELFHVDETVEQSIVDEVQTIEGVNHGSASLHEQE